jgi:hypothetical protein
MAVEKLVGPSSTIKVSSSRAGGLDEYLALNSQLELPRDAERLTEISKHYVL